MDWSSLDQASAYLPHGYCLFWNPWLITLHVGADTVIGLAYLAISGALTVYARKRWQGLPFNWLYALFASFILLCGLSHLLEVVSVWQPIYVLQSVEKVATALVSAATAAALWPMIPRLLRLPTPGDLAEANRRLSIEINERAQAVASLRAGQEQFRRLFRRSPLALQSTDLEGRLLHVSDQWLSLLDLAEDQAIGRSIFDLFKHGYCETLSREDWAHLIEAGRIERLAVTLTTVTGREIDLLVSARVERDFGDRPIVIATLVDVTAQHRAEAALRRQREIVDLLVTSIDDAIIAYDGDRSVSVWNPTAEKMTGLPAGEMRGRRINLLVPGLLESDIGAAVTRVLRGEEIGLQRVEFTDQAGIERIYDIRHSALRDGLRIIGGVAVVRDVSDLVKAEVALRRAQRLDAIGQLTGGVAHDFNNLLTAITASLSMLSSETLSSRAQRLVDTALRAADNGARLTGQLLAFARKQALNPETVDLNALVTGLNETVLRTLGSDISVTIEQGDALWPVEADPTQVELCVLNLAINARDAMGGAGRIVIATANRAGIAPDDLPRGDYVELSITDHGPGIPPAALSRIFEPFFTTKEPGKGTGLGLAQVYGVAKQSGGVVMAENAIEGGARFRLFLPRYLAEAKRQSTAMGEALRSVALSSAQPA